MALPLLWTTLTVISITSATELVPERFLRPRDFNHHPFTDVGANAATAIKPGASLPDAHPYALLASKRPREGRQFPDQDVVLYPNPPAEVLPRKPLHHQQNVQVQSLHHPQHLQQLQSLQVEQPHHAPTRAPVHVPVQQVQSAQPLGYSPLSIIPKNYAFSYSVKDQHSGDDFSHSQAHNGKATRGQYRVKLPDGRVQVVSYTADHKGYRADVQYEGEQTKTFPFPQASPIYEHQTAAPPTYVQEQPRYTPTPATYAHSPTPAPYEHQAFTPSPAPYIQDQQSFSPTPSPYDHQQYVQSHHVNPTADYNQALYASPARPSYENQYAPPTAASYEQQYENQTPNPYGDDSYIAQTPESYQSPSYAAGSPGLQAYASPSPVTYEQPQDYDAPSGNGYEGTPSPFSVEPHLRSTPAPFARHQFESSTPAPNGHVLVTPRTLFNAALARRGFNSPQQLLYKYTSPA